MKSTKTFTLLSIFLILATFNSCKKEPEVKKVDKVSATKCPRVASLTTVKSSALYTVSTYAGDDYFRHQQANSVYSNVDGVLCDARFMNPHGIAINPEGTIYISDLIAIRKIDTKGMVSTFAGKPDGGYNDYGYEDGEGAVARFLHPKKIVLDKNGHLYVIDHERQSMRKVSPSAQVTSLFQNWGYQDGPLSEAKFLTWFYTMTTGPDGSLYLFDGNHVIRKITPEGHVSTFAGPQTILRDGPKESALLGEISDMAFAPDGSLYFCDMLYNKLRKITPAGDVETISNLIDPINNWISHPSLAISNRGVIYISNYFQIFRLDADGIPRLVAGSPVTAGNYTPTKDGVGTQARFNYIKKMAIHKNYLYLTDGTTVRRMNIE